MRIYQVKRQATGQVPMLWITGLVPEAGRHRLKSELINRAVV